MEIEKIIYTKRYSKELLQLLDYLNKEWNINVADKFEGTLKSKINTIYKQPNIGIQSQLITNVRSILITKHNRLYYQVKGNILHILSLRDTRINPSKRKY